MTATAPRPLTGRKVALIACGAFGVILAVNLVLAFTAVKTFSGLVVDNSYIASQTFNEARDAQIALGWTANLREEENILRLQILDTEGNIIRPATLSVTLGRPTTDRDDQVIEMLETVGGYAGAAPLAPGAWRIELRATAPDGTAFRQSHQVYVRAAP